MNTKEAARKWECSVKTVTKLCADGVIPLAEKMKEEDGLFLMNVKSPQSHVFDFVI